MNKLSTRILIYFLILSCLVCLGIYKYSQTKKQIQEIETKKTSVADINVKNFHVSDSLFVEFLSNAYPNGKIYFGIDHENEGIAFISRYFSDDEAEQIKSTIFYPYEKMNTPIDFDILEKHLNSIINIIDTDYEPFSCILKRPAIYVYQDSVLKASMIFYSNAYKYHRYIYNSDGKFWRLKTITNYTEKTAQSYCTQEDISWDGNSMKVKARQGKDWEHLDKPKYCFGTKSALPFMTIQELQEYWKKRIKEEKEQAKKDSVSTK